MPKEQPPTTKEQILKPLEEMGIIELKEEIARLEKETKEKDKKSQKKNIRNNKIKRLLRLGTLASGLAFGGAGAGSIATAKVLGTPPEQIGAMALNWKERHIDRKNQDDPTIKGIGASFDKKRVNYDAIGEQKIDYKSGYYVSSVFDLSKSSNPPKFKIIERPHPGESITPVENAAGIVTNLLQPFITIEEMMQKYNYRKDIRDIPVMAYNKKTQTIKVGHMVEFNENYLVSKIQEISLEFDTNPDGSLKLRYIPGILRMSPLLKSKNGSPDVLPIGITRDQSTTSIDPYQANRFGSLEGGKIILVSGNIQLQVNGSFADIYAVYKKLQKDYPENEVQAFVLDNGSYNLPIWNKREDHVLTEAQIREHLSRNNEGGTALVLIDNGAIQIPK